MQNKELMQAIERCSQLLLMDCYEEFFDFVNSSPFKAQLIEEFKDDNESAMDEYGLNEDNEKKPLPSDEDEEDYDYGVGREDDDEVFALMDIEDILSRL